ncbi:MAG: hypothetical protein HOH61_07150 [Rhodospirillaceae bacterium]|nr:hypothetical protein [Rhodospirillaceae bacterium]
MDSDGLTLYKSMRGSNKTESYHQKLIRMLGAYNMSVPLADAIISEFNFRYSVKAGVRHRLLPDIGHYDHKLVYLIQDRWRKTQIKIIRMLPESLRDKVILNRYLASPGGKVRKISPGSAEGAVAEAAKS